MYDYIRGRLTYQDFDHVVVETGGVGYRIFCANPASIVAKDNHEVMVYTHYVVREDAHLLYGFASREERRMFRLLIEVSGIGPKSALAILASANPQQLALAIAQENEKFLTKFPGIGQKTAKRLILDLKDKLKKEESVRGMDLIPEGLFNVTEGNKNLHEALEALLVLGFHEQEATPVLRSIVEQQPYIEPEQLVKLALKQLQRW